MVPQPWLSPNATFFKTEIVKMAWMRVEKEGK